VRGFGKTALLLLAVGVGGGVALAYEEEPQLPQGEWLLLEGRTEEALEWYRVRYIEDPAPATREKLAEALVAHAAHLLAQHQPVEARRLLDEASGLTRDAERREQIRHLLAYSKERTTGHAVARGHLALASGDLEGARTAYTQALEDAQDAFEERQSRTLLALVGLVHVTVDGGGESEVERATALWPGGAGSTEDVQQLLRAAQTSPSLMRRLRAAADAVQGEGGELQPLLRGVALSVLLRTREARGLLGEVPSSRREPLEALLVQAERVQESR
jgi:tetratricopeptide (TPR) repeat protein